MLVILLVLLPISLSLATTGYVMPFLMKFRDQLQTTRRTMSVLSKIGSIWTFLGYFQSSDSSHENTNDQINFFLMKYFLRTILISFEAIFQQDFVQKDWKFGGRANKRWISLITFCLFPGWPKICSFHCLHRFFFWFSVIIW